MKFELIVRTTSSDGEIVEQALPGIERGEAALETLGLSLAEGKALLQGVQEHMVQQQLDEHLAQHRPCASCGRPYSNRGRHRIRLRTPFGTLDLDSPRWRRCACGHGAGRGQSFSPLAEFLSSHVHPELLYLETKWASLVSYGMTTALLHDVLPLDSAVSAVTLRNHVHKVAKRAEAQLGEEQGSFIEGCPAQWQSLPWPNGPLTVGIDGGYVRHARQPGCFEVIAGKSVVAFERDHEGSNPKRRTRRRCFGFVQTVDDKPRRRLFEHLKAQGMTENQQVVFLSDGGDSVRNLQAYLSPQAEHVLDWFHLTMRLTVLKQYAKGLPLRAQVETARQQVSQNLAPDEDEFESLMREEVEASLSSIKHLLWHGNTFRALELIRFLVMDVDATRPGPEVNRLSRAVNELQRYIEKNREFIPNYGEKYRQGETITTAFVESTVNQVVSKRLVKKQSMGWTPQGAHLLLQVRTRVLNDELENLFRGWHPAFRATPSSPAAPAF